jgi:hypothetical protein
MRRVVILVACLSLALTACANAPSTGSGTTGEGDTDLVAVLRDASERTFEAGSARMTFDFDLSAAGRTQSMNGAAEIVFGDGDPASLEAHMSFEYPGMGSGVPGGKMEMIVARGPVIYLNADALAAMFPVETPWIKLDPSTMGGGWSDMSSLGGGQTDPSSTFGFLYGAFDGEEIGEETIDGEPATHYRATIDLEAALDQVPTAQRGTLRKAIRSLREQAGGTVPELPVDVWVAAGLLKRMSYGFTMDAPNGMDGTVTMAATMTLSDVGASFKIDPPPADQVTDLGDLAGMWGDALDEAPAS